MTATACSLAAGSLAACPVTESRGACGQQRLPSSADSWLGSFPIPPRTTIVSSGNQHQHQHVRLLSQLVCARLGLQRRFTGPVLRPLPTCDPAKLKRCEQDEHLTMKNKPTTFDSLDGWLLHDIRLLGSRSERLPDLLHDCFQCIVVTPHFRDSPSVPGPHGRSWDHPPAIPTCAEGPSTVIASRRRTSLRCRILSVSFLSSGS